MESAVSRTSLFERALVSAYTRVNRRTPWHRLPFVLSLVNLIALRDQLRAENLIDTRTPGDGGRRPGVTLATATDAQRRFRTPDGSYNDLSDPDMGRASTRFARNVALTHAVPAAMPDIATPNAREISQRLMRRDEFTPATSINLLAAAWIQFQTHDWFAHAREDDLAIDIPLPEGDTWFENPMRIPQTKQDSTRVDADKDLPPTYLNTNSHWWDASSIYGSSEERRIGSANEVYPSWKAGASACDCESVCVLICVRSHVLRPCALSCLSSAQASAAARRPRRGLPGPLRPTQLRVQQLQRESSWEQVS